MNYEKASGDEGNGVAAVIVELKDKLPEGKLAEKAAETVIEKLSKGGMDAPLTASAIRQLAGGLLQEMSEDKDAS